MKGDCGGSLPLPLILMQFLGMGFKAGRKGYGLGVARRGAGRKRAVDASLKHEPLRVSTVSGPDVKGGGKGQGKGRDQGGRGRWTATMRARQSQGSQGRDRAEHSGQATVGQARPGAECAGAAWRGVARRERRRERKRERKREGS